MRLEGCTEKRFMLQPFHLRGPMLQPFNLSKLSIDFPKNHPSRQQHLSSLGDPLLRALKTGDLDSSSVELLSIGRSCVVSGDGTDGTGSALTKVPDPDHWQEPEGKQKRWCAALVDVFGGVRTFLDDVFDIVK